MATALTLKKASSLTILNAPSGLSAGRQYALRRNRMQLVRVFDLRGRPEPSQRPPETVTHLPSEIKPSLTKALTAVEDGAICMWVSAPTATITGARHRSGSRPRLVWQIEAEPRPKAHGHRACATPTALTHATRHRLCCWAVVIRARNELGEDLVPRLTFIRAGKAASTAGLRLLGVQNETPRAPQDPDKVAAPTPRLRLGCACAALGV